MRLKVVLIGICVLFADSAFAREGFYIGLGAGHTSPNGQDVPYDSFEATIPGENQYGIPQPSTILAGGSGLIYRMGINILGYGAIETIVTGHGLDLADPDSRQWAAHAHVGARLYPVWHWQGLLPEALRPLEPSLYFGWGPTYQAYVPIRGMDDLGWSTWRSFRFGIGLEYFVLSYFKLGMDYYYINAPYDNFIFNFQDSDNYPVDPEAAGTTFHQFLITLNFQFGPAPEADYSNTGMDL